MKKPIRQPRPRPMTPRNKHTRSSSRCSPNVIELFSNKSSDVFAIQGASSEARKLSVVRSRLPVGLPPTANQLPSTDTFDSVRLMLRRQPGETHGGNLPCQIHGPRERRWTGFYPTCDPTPSQPCGARKE